MSSLVLEEAGAIVSAPISIGARPIAYKLRRLSPFLGAVALLLGILGLLGWASAGGPMQKVVSDVGWMRANTAVGLMLGGAALWLASSRGEGLRRGACLLGGLVLLLGALTLLQYLGRESLGIDLLLFAEAQLRGGGAHPGRMSPHSALLFVLLGAALLTFDYATRRGRRPACLLASLSVLGAWVALLGNVYGARLLYTAAGERIGMAVHTALGCVLLGLGVLFARPEGRFMRLVTSDSPGGALARRLLPVSLLVPSILGLLLLAVAPWLALTDLHHGAALLVTLTTVAFGVLVFITARTLDDTDAQRRAAETEVALERTRGEDHRTAAAVEREELIEELRRALTIRDEFLSIAAHELRTPLSALALQLEGLRRGLVKEGPEADRGRVLRKIQTAVRQTERLNALVQSLLDVSRIGAGRLALDVEEVDMARIVQDVSGRMTDEAARQGSTLHVHAPPSVVGRWDRARIEQVLTSLLANAVKYGAGRPIEVHLSAQGEHVELHVVDRGIGIGEEDLDRIFGMFERAAPSQHYGGLGLGLYIARQIVAAHGGTLEVKSRRGEGATFTVRLPRRTPSPPDGG